MPDIVRATSLDNETCRVIDDMFDYHRWNSEKESAGQQVRDSLKAAVRAIILNVPPCPDRSAALRKLREARMDCNSAITHEGKY